MADADARELDLRERAIQAAVIEMSLFSGNLEMKVRKAIEQYECVLRQARQEGGRPDLLMSEAPAEMWMRQRPAPGHGWYQTALAPLEGAGVVRYVRADLYEALMARVQQDCLEWLGELGTDYP